MKKLHYVLENLKNSYTVFLKYLVFSPFLKVQKIFIRLYMPANDFLETTPRTGWIYVSLGDGEYDTN